MLLELMVMIDVVKEAHLLPQSIIILFIFFYFYYFIFFFFAFFLQIHIK